MRAADQLERHFARAIELLGGYSENWVPPTAGIERDVVVIGGGQAGLAVAFALRLAGIPNIAVYDAAAEGREGPWITFARMLTLRSLKTVRGPDLGIAELTYRAWHEAVHGVESWEALGKIPKEEWMRYLVWWRRATGVVVQNEARVTRIEPAGIGLRVHVDRGGRTEIVTARKVVLANGMDGCGAPEIPAIVRASLPRQLYAHSADDIDFAALRGKRIAVLGAASSAFDNSATAIERGALEVRLFARGAQLHHYNPFKRVSYLAPMHAFFELDDADKWRIMRHIFERASAPTAETVRRNTRHANFHLHLACPWTRVGQDGAEIRIETPRGIARADFVILGTGFAVDLAARPELADIAGDVALWRHRYRPPSGQESAAVASYPYLDVGYAFTEKVPGAAPWLRDIHCQNFAVTVSHGVTAGGNPCMNFGVPRLVRAIVRDFLRTDSEHHVQRMTELCEPELTGEEYRDAGPLEADGAAPELKAVRRRS